MRIGLNLLHAQPEIGGGWQYIENLIAAIDKYDGSNEYIAFVTAASRALIPGNSNFMVVSAGINERSRLQRVLFENTVLQHLAKKHRLQCMHWFANTQAVVNRVPGAVTVYDLGIYHKTALFSLAKSAYLHVFLPLTFRKAKLLLPMSEATAKDLQELFHVDSSRMIVLPPVLSDRFTRSDSAAAAEFRDRLGLPSEFWLYVAHFYPHKNHVRLLQACSKLKSLGERHWPLVLRGEPHGAESSILAAIKEYGLVDDVRFVPKLANDEMPLLYSSATAFVFPSMFEGGGMPVAEAMACGCPIVVSDIPPVREFAGDAALYFDPKETTSIADTMRRIQHDPDLRAIMTRQGLGRTTNFRAEAITKRLVEAYSRVIETGRSNS